LSVLLPQPPAQAEPSTKRATRATRSYSTSGLAGEIFVEGMPDITPSTEVTIAVVVDDTNDLMSLYVNGAFRSSVAFNGHLSALDDVNNWLGRLQYADPSFAGVFDEFRIYKTALNASALSASYAAGPNPDFLEATP
jgi:Concanavalin A-like lectin/glucanases superfamily